MYRSTLCSLLALSIAACEVATVEPERDTALDEADSAITVTSCPDAADLTLAVCSGRTGTVWTAVRRVGASADRRQELAQTFTVPRAGHAGTVRIKARLARSLTGTAPTLTAAIREVVGGVVSTSAGDDLVRGSVDASTLPRRQPVEVGIPVGPVNPAAPVALEPGKTYALVLGASVTGGDIVVGVASHKVDVMTGGTLGRSGAVASFASTTFAAPAAEDLSFAVIFGSGDFTAPALTVDSHAENAAIEYGATLTGDCESPFSVGITYGAGLTGPATATCTAGRYSFALTVVGTPGATSVTVTQTDANENTATLTRNIVGGDFTAPVLTVTAPATDAVVETSATATGACETGLSISVAYSARLSGPATATCTAGAWAFTVSTVPTVDPGAASFTVTQTDAATNTTSVTRNVTADQPRNYWGSGADGVLNTTGSVSFPNTTDGEVVVKHYTSLTINSGHAVTTSTRARGLVVYVAGNATINGTLTMSARGANVDPVAAGVPATGLRFIRRTSGGTATLAASDLTGTGGALVTAEANQRSIAGNGSLFTIARGGAGGGASSTAAGTNGSAGQSGGGGSGHFSCTNYAYGTAGTCFSGGSGGGGSCQDAGMSTYAAAANGGRGGHAGTAFAGGCSWNSGGGGAGNPGGNGYGCGAAGGTGTGGLLVLIVKGTLTVGAGGVISADGVAGGAAAGGMAHRMQGGGGSGGGNVLVLYAGSYANAGSIRANGGAGGWGAPAGYEGGSGGAGGNGSVQVAQIQK